MLKGRRGSMRHPLRQSGAETRYAPKIAGTRHLQNHLPGLSCRSHRARRMAKAGWVFCNRTVTLGFPYLMEKVNRLVAATDPPKAIKRSEIGRASCRAER